MITARTIKQHLSGQSFSIKNEVDGRIIKFQFPANFVGWPRQGGEAIVAPIMCTHPDKGDMPSIMKFFLKDLPERAERQSHLVRFKLASLNWMYEAVPYTWIDDTVAGHRIYGHIARHIFHNAQGDDFRIVRGRPRDNMDGFTEYDRREMACQLCYAIVGLEKLKIVHSDLSPANIVLGKYSDTEARCVLIDYDGFHNPNVPKLPGQARIVGTAGYQHPSLIRRIEQGNGADDNLFVENDRFALGVLCFELMTWTTAIADSLPAGQTGFVNEDELKQRRLDVPAAAKSVWPEGFKLLKQAVKEPDIRSLPGPEDWLQALNQGRGPDRRDWKTTVLLRIYWQRGNQTPRKEQRLNFKKQDGHGDLTMVDACLSGIAYNYKNNNDRCVNFKLHITLNTPVMLKRDGKLEKLGIRPDEIEVRPGDQILTDGWHLEFQDAPLAQTDKK